MRKLAQYNHQSLLFWVFYIKTSLEISNLPEKEADYRICMILRGLYVLLTAVWLQEQDTKGMN